MPRLKAGRPWLGPKLLGRVACDLCACCCRRHPLRQSWWMTDRCLGDAGIVHWASWWLSGKESTRQCRRRRFDPWLGKIPWRRKWQPTPVFLPEIRCHLTISSFRSLLFIYLISVKLLEFKILCMPFFWKDGLQSKFSRASGPERSVWTWEGVTVPPGRGFLLHKLLQAGNCQVTTCPPPALAKVRAHQG